MRYFVVGLASVCVLSACGGRAAPPPDPPPASASATSKADSPPFALLGDHCSLEAPFDFSRVRVAGRSERSPRGLTFAWSGTALELRFRGSELALELDDSGRNWFGVEIDGQKAASKLEVFVGPRCYAIARHLSPGEHRVKVTRLTEASLGETTLVAATAGAGGELLPAAPGPQRRVEIIGDSITAAYGVEGADRNCHFSSETENAELSYASLFAQRAHAEVRMIAWSGKGVFSNRGSTTDTVPMPALWERTLPMRDDSHWDFSSWPADAIVIELGTNDFAPENKDKSPFAGAYSALIARVHAVYPGAAIFCALSPLLGDQWPPQEHARSTARDGIRAAMAEQAARGVDRLFYLEHANETDAEGWGCDWHPSRVTHERMARELFDSFAKNLSW